VATVIFVLLRVKSGGPGTALLGEYASQETINKLNQELGFDRPIFEQYLSYMYRLAKGDLGKSYVSQRPVMELILGNIPFTLYILGGSIIFGVPLGLVLGMLAALKKDLPVYTAFRVFSLTWVSVPSFVVGTMCILLFSVYLGWFPTASIQRASDIWGNLKATIMPSLTLGLHLAALLANLTYTCFVEILVEDYIRTSQSLGLPKYIVLFKYGLRNALIPIVTLMGIYMIGIIGSSPVVETVFARPGLGNLLVRAIQQSDFPVTQGALVFFSILVMVINLSIDIVYSLIDPRIGYHG
jgi:peptide/nickel transport system permease protein/glutathione transport system permease protein